MTPRSWLADHAEEISQHLHVHFGSAGAAGRQVLALAEEAGEFVGAYRRWSGQARRTGTEAEMFSELADVVITAYVTAREFDCDLDEWCEKKLDKVYTRGWRDDRD